MSNATQSTVLTPAEGYDPTRMIFSEAISGVIPESKPKIEFKRINISTRNEDGSIGELIIPTERLFSFGVSENTSQETGKINGYTFPLCLWNKDRVTKEEKIWTTTFNNIVNQCIKHLVKTREEIEMFELTTSDLNKSKGGLNPLYWKKEKFKDDSGKTVLRVVPGTGPTLYTKLIYSKKNDKFLSQFFNMDDEPINALELMGKYCYTRAAIKIESIFIGSRISLQIKLYEAVVEPTSSGMKRLLSRPKANSKVLQFKSENKNVFDEDEDDTGSLVNESDDESDDDSDDNTDVLPTPTPTPKKKIIRKVKKVVKKS